LGEKITLDTVLVTFVFPIFQSVL